MEASDDAQAAEIDRLTTELSDATRQVAYLTGELEAVRDLARGDGAAARYTLAAIFLRASRAVEKGN